MIANIERRTVVLFLALGAFLIAGRLCHSGILWADGDYHLAAAMQWHGGKALYRDLWYDKPPLTALLYLIAGEPTGVALSLLEAAVACAACLGAFAAAKQLGGWNAGGAAAALVAFFLTFYLPAAVIPVAPDLLMIVPHLLAISCAFAGRPVWAGVLAAAAFWINAKGVFVLVACLLIAPISWAPMLLGFAAPCAAGAVVLLASGAWSSYIEQVWRWSALYARNTPISDPWRNALFRSANWAGFHAALVAGAAIYFAKSRTPPWKKLLWWTTLSAAGVALGMRFLPRYYFQLVAPLCVIAALGWASLPRRRIAAMACGALLLLPLIRWGPRYLTLALENTLHRKHAWSDLALDEDDRATAEAVKRLARPGATLFVWGYRPGLYVYTGLASPSLFWDSQPLTGVPADRHLSQSNSIAPEWARRNRAVFAASRPDIVVDALSRFNGALAINRYPDLAPWLEHYRPCGQTQLSIVLCVQ